MPTTTNFGWTTPADTDLVKDGAAAIRTLGNGVDTSLVDLKGGTTGQVLSKASNTDLDYSWVTPNVGDITEVQAGTGISVASGTGPIPVVTNTVATAYDAKGDLIVGTGADTFAKLTVGTNGYTLVADSAEATGLKWRGFVGVRLEKTASQSINNATYTAITYTGETFDTNSFHDNSTNTSRITIPSGLGGYYLIAYQISWATSGNGQRLIRIYVNGSTIPYMNGFANPSAGYGNNFAGATILNLAAGDYIELFGYQDSGGALNCDGNNANGGLGRFEATYLGA